MTTSIPAPAPEGLTFAAAYLVEDQDLHVNEIAPLARMRWVEDAYRLGYTTATSSAGSTFEVVDVDGDPWVIVTARVRPLSEVTLVGVGTVLQLPEVGARKQAA